MIVKSNLETTRDSISQNGFLIMFSLYIAYDFLRSTTLAVPGSLKYPIYLLAIVFIVVKTFFLDSYTFKSFVEILFFGIIGGIVSYNIKSDVIMMFTIFCIGANNVDFDNIIKIYVVEMILLLLLVGVLSKLGYIMNYTYFRDGHLRNSFGTNYPTDFAAHIFYIVIGIIYLLKDKMKLIITIILSLLSIWVLLVTDSRLDGYLTMMVVIIFYLYYSCTKKYNIRIPRVLGLFIVLGFLVINYMTYHYNASSNYYVALNKIMSGRLYLGNLAFSRYPLSIFGMKIQQTGFGGLNGYMLSASANRLNYFFIDSSFVNMLLSYGIAFSTIILYKLSDKMYWLIKNNEYIIPLLFIFITISSAIDQHLLEIAYNPFILIMFAKRISVEDSLQSN